MTEKAEGSTTLEMPLALVKGNNFCYTVDVPLEQPLPVYMRYFPDRRYFRNTTDGVCLDTFAFQHSNTYVIPIFNGNEAGVYPIHNLEMIAKSFVFKEYLCIYSCIIECYSVYFRSDCAWLAWHLRMLFFLRKRPSGP